ncbi:MULTISPECIES: hypothetical protein [unclassified Bradyrhizobium]|uniref:hypothetical protein n=1 Tax=unclassified Bradyrhizobium TaxID=2631580 RepID=UPI002306B53F|nr:MULTISPECIES: hypothetical protein [unclassified Bradyrhizobium]
MRKTIGTPIWTIDPDARIIFSQLVVSLCSSGRSRCGRSRLALAFFFLLRLGVGLFFDLERNVADFLGEITDELNKNDVI